MLIAQISDTHLIVDGPGSDQRIADFRAVIADINTLDPAPDVIVHTGDVTHNGTPAEYVAAAEILSAARAPVYAMMGNKDDRANLRASFSDHAYLAPSTDFITYAVDDFPVRLLILDTVNPGSKKGGFCSMRFTELEDLAARDPSKPLAVFMHHPPFEVLVGPERHHFDDLAEMARLASAIGRNDGVAGLFCGHVHRLTKGQVGSAPAMVASSVATELRYGPYPAAADGRAIYLVHQFGDGDCFDTELHFAGSEAASQPF